MQFSKEEVLSIITTQPNGNIEEKQFKKKFPELYQEIQSLSFPEEFKWTQKLYHYFNDDLELNLGLCPVCGKRCKFRSINLGYLHHCSKKCTHLDKNTELKRRDTCILKFGVDNYSKTKECHEKMEQTCLERHGAKHILQLDKFKKKFKQSMLEKHGVENPSQSKEIQEKKKQNCIEKHGVKHPSQLKEVQEKNKQTCLNNLGVEHPAQCKKVQDKIKLTNQKRYNKDYYFQTDECKNKIKQINQEKRGVDYPMQSKDVQEKSKQTCLKNNGVEYPTQSKKIQEKLKQTNIERHGYEYFSQTPEFAKYHKKCVKYDGLTFDSSWEVEVYKFCKEHNIPCKYQPDITLEYIFQDKPHYYHPDFLINGQLYEIKGNHFFDGNKMINPYDRNQDDFYEAKHQCMINNGVIILKKEDINKLKNNINIF